MTKQIRHDIHLQELAIYTHGILTALHTLGVVYNLRKRNTFDVIAHSLGIAYDGHAVLKHIRDLRKLEDL